MKVGLKIGRLRYAARLLVGAHLLNPLWHSRAERHRKRYLTTQKATMQYLKRYVKPLEEYRFNPKEEEVSKVAERAYTIWLQGEKNAPPLVKACIESMRKHLDMEIAVLDEKSIFDYISLPDYIMRKWKSGKIRAAHFTDICRVELLYNYGGLWFDSTDYLTASPPKEIMESPFFVYMSGENVGGWYAFIQNCFIRSRRFNPLIAAWREAIHRFWQNENDVVCYYTHQMLFRLAVESNPAAREAFEKMPKIIQDPTHALWPAHFWEEYDKRKVEELTKDAFFQKTSYKSKGLENISPTSIAARLINNGI